MGVVIGQRSTASKKSVMRVYSTQEADELLFEEKKERCKFYQHYNFSEKDFIGAVSAIINNFEFFLLMKMFFNSMLFYL